MADISDAEIKLRCIEAAASRSQVHADGLAVGVVATASVWFDWIKSSQKAGTLGLPEKKK